MRRLAAAHEKTIPFLGARIKAVVAGKIPVAKLLEQLNDDKFVREAACRSVSPDARLVFLGGDPVLDHMLDGFAQFRQRVCRRH